MINISAPLYFRTLWRYRNCIIIIIINSRKSNSWSFVRIRQR